MAIHSKDCGVIVVDGKAMLSIGGVLFGFDVCKVTILCEPDDVVRVEILAIVTAND